MENTYSDLLSVHFYLEWLYSILLLSYKSIDGDLLINSKYMAYKHFLSFCS